MERCVPACGEHKTPEQVLVAVDTSVSHHVQGGGCKGFCVVQKCNYDVACLDGISGKVEQLTGWLKGCGAGAALV